MASVANTVPIFDKGTFVPGTVHLVDLEGVIRAKHASGGNQDIVLVPAPSADPEDPLNWSLRRKILSTACFFGAPIESLCEISVTDIYFTHERGQYIAIYALFLAGSNFSAPIFSGFIADGQGWHWVFYWCAIFCAIGFIILFFFMEETNYQRSTITDTESNLQSGAEILVANGEAKSATPNQKHEIDEPVVSEEGLGTVTYHKKTYLDKLKLFNSKAMSQHNQLGRMIIRPLIFLTFPVIFYAGFSYGSNVIWFSVLNGTASLVLSSPPYNFDAGMVGVSYVSPLIGVIIGSIYTGQVGKWFVMKMARRNKGIMEPELRLWMFTLSLILIPGSLILWGIGAAHHVHWFGLVFAMCVIAITNTIGLQVSVSYCIDSYRDLSGEAMITVILVRNTMAFAIGYGITPWVTNMSFQNAFIVAAFAGLAQVSTFLIFVKWGKGLRKASVHRYYRYVEEMAAAGLIH